MLVGVPKEIKTLEYRVGLVPAGVRELVQRGHQVVIESRCGEGAGMTDAQYAEAGAEVVATAAEIYTRADLVVKVKEPQSSEYRQMRPGQTLFTYLHLAPARELTEGLLQSGAMCIAYETVTDSAGGLPLLAPMSEVAGRLSVQEAALCLEKSRGGRGVLMGGVPGVEPAHVVILGGGVVGLNAARMAIGMGARVTLLDKSLPRLRYLDDLLGGRLCTLYSTAHTLDTQLRSADAVIGAVLIPGAATPRLISRDGLALMQAGSVLVDVAIDQGGCFETSRPTTHSDPVFEVDGVLHYCVANMPGAVPRTASLALTNATLPYVLALADGPVAALRSNPHLLQGLNACAGEVTHPAVAAAQGRRYASPDSVLAGSA